MKLTLNQRVLTLVVTGVVAGATLLVLTGCAGLASRPPSTSAPKEVTAEDLAPVPSRINPKGVIDAADAAGCDLSVLLYSEGKRDSKLALYCQGGLPIPTPQGGF